MNENITALLQELATKLGTTIEHLWSILIKQAYIYGIIHGISLTLLSITIPISINLYFRFNKSNEFESKSVEHVMYRIILSLTTILWMAECTNLPKIVAGLFNPEYWALSEVIHIIH